jgi:putative SOS response-associated peptidase YedK
VRTGGNGGREMLLMRWGLPGSEEFGGYPSPTSATRTPARLVEAAISLPCAATAFCQQTSTKARRVDLIRPWPRGAPFAFAGVWGPLTGQCGTNANPIVVGGHQLFSFLTTEPNAIVQPIHQNTMPLILTEEILRPLARGRHG